MLCSGRRRKRAVTVGWRMTTNHFSPGLTWFRPRKLSNVIITSAASIIGGSEQTQGQYLNGGGMVHRCATKGYIEVQSESLKIVQIGGEMVGAGKCICR